MIKINEWVTLIKKPVTIGMNSKGFIVDKKVLRLRATKDYTIKIMDKFCYDRKNGGLKNMETKEQLLIKFEVLGNQTIQKISEVCELEEGTSAKLQVGLENLVSVIKFNTDKVA